MIDLRSHICALKAAWTCRITNSPDNHIWSFIPKQFLLQFGEDYFIVKSTITDIKMFTPLKNIPRFYQEVILSYNKSKIVRNEDFYNNIRNQTIWCNKYIKFKGETLLFKNWIKDGVILVENLKLGNGILDIGYLSRVIKDKRRFL